MLSTLKRKMREVIRYQSALGSRSAEVLDTLRRIETRLEPPAGPPVSASYAIEAEDLVLERLLNVFVFGFEWREGRYIDIGAHHPVSHSNTYRLYLRGWRGVCVEPNPRFAEDFATLRPRDVFLNAGISAEASRLTYHQFDDPLINGFFGEEVVAGLSRAGKTLLGSVEVPCLGIRDFLAVHGGAVDVVNIDIETQDAQVLAAWDWGLCRPAIICAEVPITRIADALRGDIAGILGKAGYSLVSKVWQSAFFVADEHLDRFAATSEWAPSVQDAASPTG